MPPRLTIVQGATFDGWSAGVHLEAIHLVLAL
jgi:hypothetical protein